MQNEQTNGRDTKRRAHYLFKNKVLVFISELSEVPLQK